jgi:hypothetical protein
MQRSTKPMLLTFHLNRIKNVFIARAIIRCMRNLITPKGIVNAIRKNEGIIDSDKQNRLRFEAEEMKIKGTDASARAWREHYRKLTSEASIRIMELMHENVVLEKRLARYVKIKESKPARALARVFTRRRTRK